MTKYLLFALLGVSLFETACAGAMINSLEPRAEFELGCDELEYTRFNGSTYAAEGCGCRAVYVCASAFAKCNLWVLDSVAGECTPQPVERDESAQ